MITDAIYAKLDEVEAARLRVLEAKFVFLSTMRDDEHRKIRLGKACDPYFYDALCIECAQIAIEIHHMIPA
jgi:hypothetical protein